MAAEDRSHQNPSVNSERKGNYERNYSFCMVGGGPIEQSKMDMGDHQKVQAAPMMANNNNAGPAPVDKVTCEEQNE